MKSFTKKIIILLSFALSLPLNTVPSYGEPSLVDAYVVIVGGGTSESALPPLEAKFKSSGLSKLVSLPDNSILTVESKNISGLNPGFHIAVLGFCTQKERAESLREVANFSFPGSYIKKVHVDSSRLSCPAFRLQKGTNTDGFRLKTKIRVAKEQAWPKWYVYEKPVHREADGTVYKSLLLQVVARDGAVLNEYDFKGRFDSPGVFMTSEFRESIFAGGRSFIVARDVAEWGDAGNHETGVFYFNGTEIKILMSERDPRAVFRAFEYSIVGENWMEIEVTCSGYWDSQQEGEEPITVKYIWGEKEDKYKVVSCRHASSCRACSWGCLGYEEMVKREN